MSVFMVVANDRQHGSDAGLQLISDSIGLGFIPSPSWFVDCSPYDALGWRGFEHGASAVSERPLISVRSGCRLELIGWSCSPDPHCLYVCLKPQSRPCQSLESWKPEKIAPSTSSFQILHAAPL